MKRLLGLLLLLLVTPAFAQSDDDDVVFSPQAIVVNPRPSFEVDVFLDRGGSNDVPTYQVGESIQIGVRVSEDAYVYLFNVRSDGGVQQLLPNRYDSAGQNNFLRGGETRYFPPNNARYEFAAQPPRGLDKVVAVASRTELNTRELAQFRGEEDFATSSLGEEGFARSLSIVVRPIQQSDWVTDTALLYVGDRPQQAAYGTIAVRSSPGDARVFIDGNFVGYSPLSYGTRPGRHDVRIERSGYETYSQSVNVRPGGTVTVDAGLSQRRRTGQVQFTSQPSGASVYVDGRYAGTTPTSNIELEEGRYEARFELSGHQDGFVSFRVDRGSSQTVRADLRTSTGGLHLQGNVGGAQVYLNGDFYGNIANGTGRLELQNLQPGTYELSVVAPGYSTYVEDVRIRGGEVVNVRFRQERR